MPKEKVSAIRFLGFKTMIYDGMIKFLTGGFTYVLYVIYSLIYKYVIMNVLKR